MSDNTGVHAKGGLDHGLRRREVLAAGALACVAPGAVQARAEGPDPSEFIRVGRDRWTFRGARTGRRFVPFGSNLVLRDKADLDIFGPRYEPARYASILDACRAQGVNTLKVFVPLGSALPDPQEHGKARIADGYLDSLRSFLDLCRAREMRAVVTLAEWGGHGCKWWQEGGQYWGRRPWRDGAGPDSIASLVDFWRRLCSALRDDPTVFAFTPVVELTTPSGNLTPPWAPPPERVGILPGDIALWYWRRWLQAKYRSMYALNAAWKTHHARLEDIPEITYAYDFAADRYVEPERMVLDYQNFREWTTLRYLKPQIAAIRRYAPRHMVTISNHERSWNLWKGAARHFLGYTPSEQAPYVDYVTHHFNRDESELERTLLERYLRELEVMVRFACAGKPMPVIIEEFTFGSADPQKTAQVQAEMVRRTIGHASGWLTWYLQYPEGANAADARHPSAWFAADMRPTAWGERARVLATELQSADLARKPAARILTLDRNVELVPKDLGKLMQTFLDYDKHPQPVDFRVPHEKDLDVRL